MGVEEAGEEGGQETVGPEAAGGEGDGTVGGGEGVELWGVSRVFWVSAGW